MHDARGEVQAREGSRRVSQYTTTASTRTASLTKRCIHIDQTRAGLAFAQCCELLVRYPSWHRMWDPGFVPSPLCVGTLVLARTFVQEGTAEPFKDTTAGLDLWDSSGVSDLSSGVLCILFLRLKRQQKQKRKNYSSPVLHTF